MKINDAVFGALFLVLAGALLIGAQTLPQIRGLAYGPSLYPTVIGVALLPAAIGLIVSGLRRWRDAPLVEFSDWVRSPRQSISFCLVLACILFYILASDSLGFLITAVLILTCLFGWLWRKAWASVALAIGVTAILHVLFYSLLLVPLPWGVLKPIAW